MGKDPVALRLELLTEHPKHSGVLKLAAEKSNWGTPLKAAAGERCGRGVAVHESFNSFVAQVAEVLEQLQPQLQMAVMQAQLSQPPEEHDSDIRADPDRMRRHVDDMQRLMDRMREEMERMEQMNR